MTFVDVLSSALLNATQETQPWRICDHVHAPHRGHVTGECKNPRPVNVSAAVAETLIAQGWIAPEGVHLGVQEASPDTVGTGIGALTETSSEEAPGMDHGTQPALPFAESSAR